MRTNDYEVTIFFTPPKPGQLPKFWAEPEPLEVEPGTHTIRMNLVTVSDRPDAAATFAPRAIDWCDSEGYLMACPQAFSLTYSPLQLELTDRNLSGCQGTYKFILYVHYEGFAYASPDPTIINKQPSGELTLTFDESWLANRPGRFSAA